MKFFNYNLQLKILSVVAATALWFFVVGIENTAYRFPQDIDVHAINLDSNLSIASDLGKAKVLVNAPADVFKNLVIGDFNVSVDLKNAAAGEYDLPLSAIIKNDKVSLIRIEPATIHIKLEPITSKEVKIKVFTTGNAQKGYTVKDMKLSAQTATITGAQSLISKITSLNAEVALDGTQSTNFKTNLNLKIDPSGVSDASKLENITIKPDQVSVDVTVTADQQQKTVIVKPNIQGALEVGNLNQKIEINPLTIVVQGEEATLNNLNYIETEQVNIDLLKNQKPLKVNLIIPKNITLVDQSQSSVTITLKGGATQQLSPAAPTQPVGQ